MGSSATSLETRLRLIEAAGELFAQKGLHCTTVRQICLNAKANIAAINYHFHDKETLYLEVLRHIKDRAHENFPVDINCVSDKDAALRLKSFVKAFISRIFDETLPGWHGKLWTRELMDPSPFLDILIKEDLRQRSQTLLSIVKALLGKGADAEQVKFCAFSILGQCLYYRHAQPFIYKAFDLPKITSEMAERMADHIIKFSIGGIESLKSPISAEETL